MASEELNRIRQLFDELESRDGLIELLGDTETAQGVKIFIGSENKLFSLSGSSVILSPYKDANHKVVGVLGVIGPTRLNYARIVPVVDYTANIAPTLIAYKGLCAGLNLGALWPICGVNVRAPRRRLNSRPMMNDDTSKPEDHKTAPAAEATPMADAAPAEAMPPEVDATEALKAENADLRDKLLRTIAEMENLEEAHRARDLGHPLLCDRRFRPRHADRHRSAQPRPHGTAGRGPRYRRRGDEVVDRGIEMTEREMQRLLAKHGVKPIEAEGQKFDPHKHQAMFEVPDPSRPEGTVVQVVQTGFAIGERVLRPAMVGVAKGGGSKGQPAEVLSTRAPERQPNPGESRFCPTPRPASGASRHIVPRVGLAHLVDDLGIIALDQLRGGRVLETGGVHEVGGAQQQGVGPGEELVGFGIFAGVGRIGAQPVEGTAAPQDAVRFRWQLRGAGGTRQQQTQQNRPDDVAHPAPQAMSPATIRLTPAAFMSAQAPASDPPVSMARQASSMT